MLIDLEEKVLHGYVYPKTNDEEDCSVCDNIIDSIGEVNVSSHVHKLAGDSGHESRITRPPEQMVVSISGDFVEMRDLIPLVSDALRGANVSMTTSATDFWGLN